MRFSFVSLILCSIFLPVSMNAQLTWSKSVHNNPAGGVLVERADFTGDGYPDLFVYGGETNISVFFNTGGLFDFTHNYTAAEPLNDVALLDLNRDGKMDVVGCSGNFNLLIMLGNGDGTLTLAQNIETPCFWVAAADFNGDGRPDIAVGVPRTDDMEGTLDNQVVVFLGDGNGGVSGQVVNDNVNFNFSNGFRCELNGAAKAANFTGDKVPDLAMTADCSNGTVSQAALIVGKGDGTGHFAFHKDLEFNMAGHMRLRLSDVDQNGHEDMIGVGNGGAANGTGSTALVVFSSNGDGTFVLRPVAKFSTADGIGDFITAGTVIDLDGDGITDGIIALDSIDAAGNETFSMQFLKGQGNGTYKLAQPSPLAHRVTDMVWGDFNKDSRADLALMRPGTTDVWLNQTTSARICPVTENIPSLYPCYFGSPTGTFHFYATPRDNRVVNAIQIYVDGVVKFQTLDDLLDANVHLPSGSHRVTIKAWDDLGPFSSTQTIVVCTNAADRTVRICSPTDGSTINSSTHLISSAFSQRKFLQLQVYFDGRVVYRDSNPYEDFVLEPGPGTHRITVKGWDDLGAFSSSIIVTVP